MGAHLSRGSATGFYTKVKMYWIKICIFLSLHRWVGGREGEKQGAR